MDDNEKECRNSEFSQILEICSEDCHFERLAFDKSHLRLIACNKLGNVYIFDLETNSFVSFNGIGRDCSSVSLNAGIALIGTVTGFVRCIDTANGAVLSERACFEHEQESSPVTDVDIKPGSEVTLALACLNATVLIWDIPKLHPRFRLRGTTDILQAFYTFDGSSIVTCHPESSLNVWHSVDLKPKTEIMLRDELEMGNLTAFAINKDNTMIIAGSECGNLVSWDLMNVGKFTVVPVTHDPVIQVAFVQMDSVAVITSSGNFRLVDSKLGQTCGTFHVSDAVCRAVFDHGHRMYCATIDTADGRIRILKVPTLKETSSKVESGKAKVESTIVSKRSQKNSDNKTEARKPLDAEKLRKMVRHLGQFAEENRGVIWKTFLQIPNNKEAFKTLLERGLHPSFKKEQFKPSNFGFDGATGERFRQFLSALAHWTPLLGEFKQLPAMAAPFFQVFQVKLLTCFEVFATVLTNWCANYFQFFPAPPVPMLAELEQLIEKQDKSIVEHMEKAGVTTQTYLWPLMSTLMAQVLPGDEWSRVWDHIIVHPINFLGYVAVSYVIVSKQALLRLKDFASIESYFRNPNTISVPKLLREAYRIYEEFPPKVLRVKVMELLPLTEGVYPILANFPKISIDYRLHEKEKLQTDLDEWKRQHDAVDLLEADVGKLHEEEERWRVKEATMRVAEAYRRNIMMEEEAKITAQRIALKQATRELRQKELDVLQMRSRGITRDRMLERELYVERMEDDIVRKSQLRDRELLDTLEDAETRNFKHQSDLLKLDTELGIGTEVFRERLRRDFDHTAAGMLNNADSNKNMVNGNEIEATNGSHTMSVSEINRIRRQIARRNNSAFDDGSSGTR